MYPYDVLPTRDSIRVFSLDAANPRSLSSLPSGILSNVRLDANPHYYALSHRWGDPNDLVPIDCGEHHLHVTKNLDSALKCLRSVSETDTELWVDAICIDQQNDAERGHQVRNMGRIYKQAKRVLVWLGPSPNGYSSSVFANTTRPVKNQHFRKKYLNSWRSHTLTEQLRELTCQEWFHRTWTCQEIGSQA